jgi:PTH2 family peptidyl-tRNA hydrolase
MQNPVMYIFVNKGLGMSTGKVAAQVGHAVGRSLIGTVGPNPALIHEYMEKGETKIVLEVRDTEHLLMAERYLNEHNLKTYLVIDEGRTEIAPLSPTAMATEIVDKDSELVKFALGGFKTYKDPKPPRYNRRQKFWRAILGN